MRFAKKVVLITGAGGGLGLTMVRQFLDEGATVMAADLSPIAPLPDGALYQRLDVTDEESWIKAFQRLAAELGGLDILVNNAGIFTPNIPFEDMPLDLWRRHFAVNCDGVFLGCKHAILQMKALAKCGAIVNIGSGMSIKAVPTAAAYCATKAAVLMTTRTAAAAAGAYGIRVNAVLPGPVRTEMLLGNLVEGQAEADFLEGLLRSSPLQRLADPEDIARAVLFLADPQNGAVTGVHLPVDGGNMPGG